MFDQVAAIETESALIADAAAKGDVGAAVPSCPGWTLRSLVLHVGEVQRFWAGAVRARGVQPDHVDVQPGADLAAWFRASTGELTAALRDAGADSPCWTWWGSPATSGAVARHQVQEAAVHRWDAQTALGGAPSPLPADV